MLSGNRTYITLGVTALFLIGGFFGVDIGISKEQAEIIFGGLVTIALAFIRSGSKNDAASGTQATTLAVTGSQTKADAAAASVGNPSIDTPKP